MNKPSDQSVPAATERDESNSAGGGGSVQYHSGWSSAWLVVALLLPVALLNYLDRQMIASMKSSVVADIPMSTIGLENPTAEAKDQASLENTNWGHMLGQFKWVYAIFSPIGGLLADRFSRRYTICGSLAVWSMITFLTGTVTSYQGLLWTRTLMGISEAFYIPAALALISDHHLGTTRSKAVGIHQMGFYFGGILGGFSGYAADSPAIGWRWAFKYCGLFGLAYSVPLIIFLKEIRNPYPLSAIGRSAGESRLGSTLVGLAELLTNISFLLLVAYFTLPAMAGWVIRDWMPSILKESFAINQGRAGVTATLFWQVAAIFAAIVGGALADRWMRRNQRGRIYVSAIGMSLIIPALILVGFATSGVMVPGSAGAPAVNVGGSLSLAIMALILFGIGWGFFDCNNMPILCQIVRPELRATGYGLMNLVSISCGGFADKIFGILRDKQVPTAIIFQTFALVCVVSVVLVLLIRPRQTETTSS